MVLLQRNLYFSKDPEGVELFPGGGGGGGGGGAVSYSICPNFDNLWLG